jgi:thimet oligopeptidase
MRRALTFAALLSLVLACGGDPPSNQAPPKLPPPPEPPRVATAPAAPAPAMLPLDVDPVPMGLTKEGVTRVCDEGLARAKSLLDEVKSQAGRPPADLTWDTTLGKLDLVFLAMKNAGDFPALMAVAHPDGAVREAAKACEPKVDRFDTALYLDDALAGVVKAYAQKGEPLKGARARLLEHTLRDFRRNGLELPKDKRRELTEMNERLTALAQEFETNLSAATLSLEATPKQLDGLPASYMESHKPGPSGKIKVTTDYPDYFPVIQYAKDRAFALELYKLFDNRAAEKNVALLESIIALRHKKALLLGYDTWAAYVLEKRMAKDPKRVAAFLDDLRRHVDKKSAEEMADFRAMKKKLGQDPKGPVYPSDRLYLEDQVRKEKYGLDSKAVSEYLEVGKVKTGLLTVTEKLYGVHYKEAPDAPKWHGDVTAYDVTDDAGRPLGRFYFDLYPRDGKYKHAAVFSIRDTRLMADGSRLLPIAAIECNFPKPAPGAPALMSHQDAVTFFHEFGHVLHHLLSRSELAAFSGTSVQRDFVEAPSQMLEEWAWSKEVLDLFATHHKTGEKIPDALYTAMVRSRSFGRGLHTSRQLFLAALDQSYHTAKEHPVASTKVLEDVQNAYTPFKYVENTHFQATFGHLMGYDASYYGYQWALALAEDMFSRFKKDGLFDPKAAADYRAAVLEPGGSEDAEALVTRFLGRPPSNDAYKAWLVEKPGAAPPAKGPAKAPPAKKP